ncbi:MAG: hypothetical protein IH605_12945 [Burkholderiales bacterium]|nr:hypothetical protein [Burkholderiales bacterium]
MAAVAALASFKSSAAEPIYLGTMGIVALGWAAVLLQALAAERRAAGAFMAAAGSETRGVIEGLTQAMGEQMQRSRGELVRVDDLLGHAIEQLMAAFHSVRDQVSRHQIELAQEADGAQGMPDGERLRAAVERVASEVNGAVTALQFRDVVGQKLGHVRRELEVLEQVMQRVRELSAEQSNPAAVPGQAGTPEAELAAQVLDLLRELEQAKAASPVRQELMHAGEVDLF